MQDLEYGILIWAFGFQNIDFFEFFLEVNYSKSIALNQLLLIDCYKSTTHGWLLQITYS